MRVSMHGLALGMIFAFGVTAMIICATMLEARSLPGEHKLLQTTASGGVKSERKTMCIIAPFKGEGDQERETAVLSLFCKYMDRWLERQRRNNPSLASTDHRIIIARQSNGGGLLFNRGGVLNAGARVASAMGCSYIIVHDIDLLPVDPRIDYTDPGPGTVRHLCPPGVHPVYVYPMFLGGAFAVRLTEFFDAGGFADVYWGWHDTALLCLPSLALMRS